MQPSNTKILVVAPNMQPMHCGVSDYSLLLGHFWEERANTVAYCSLNDKYAQQLIEEEHLLRIPKQLMVAEKKRLFQHFVNQVNPSLLILNYAGYGFQEKGLPVWLIKALAKLSSTKCKIVIVFHELWIGQYAEENIKSKLLGRFQKAVIKKLITRIQPIEVFVTTQVFQRMLDSIGIKSKVAKVFNNLGLSTELNVEEQIILNKVIEANSQTITLSFFGSIFNFTNTSNTISFLNIQADLSTKPLTIFSLGKLNEESQQTWQLMASAGSDKLRFIQLGMVSSALANAILQQVDYGISAYPVAFWSKSGSIAAMLANGLEVITVGDDSSNLSGFRKGLDIPVDVFHIDSLPEGFILKKRKQHKINATYNNVIFEAISNRLVKKAELATS